MLVIGDDIERRQFLKNFDEKSLKNASYYLRIDAIIPAGEKAGEYDFDKPVRNLTLEPRDVAWIVSKEEFSLTDYKITALVTLRSSFTKQGLLALDVGLVDPGYKGPIGTVVINFSNNKVSLAEGDKFFRVVFFEHDEITGNQRVDFDEKSKTQYIRARHAEIERDYSSTFLGETRFLESLSDKLLEKFMMHFLKKYWLRILFTAVILPLLLTWGGYFLLKDKFPVWTKEEIKMIVEELVLDREQPAE